MSKSGVLAISLTGLCLLARISGQAQKLPWHTKHADAMGGITRVLLVPPDVHVDQWSTTSGRELAGSNEFLQRTICGNLERLLAERKLAVNDMLCLGEGESSSERRDAIVAVGARFRELVTAWSKPRHAADLLEAFHLGDELEAAKKLGVDALVVVCADGNLKTKGEKIMGNIGGGGVPGEGLLLHLGIIRPLTGQLVFFTEKDMGGDFLKHPDHLENALEKAVQAAFGPPSSGAK